MIDIPFGRYREVCTGVGAERKVQVQVLKSK